MNDAHAILFGDHPDVTQAFSIIEVNGLTISR